MRLEDIRFKAKRLDNKQWVEGDLLHSYEGGAIIVPITEEGEHGGAFSVDPSTVCQFTGAKDANGAELYEHDIIHFKGHKPKAVIKWVGDAYAFMVEYDGNLSYLDTVLGIGKVIKVGNVFDKM